MTGLLIANRGEIALRIDRTARRLGHRTVAVYSTDEPHAAHARAADAATDLGVAGPAAYLDIDAARRENATLIHPGYGFLSENAEFARRCTANELTFVGPDAATLDLFGNKTASRALAVAHGVPVLAATDGPTDLSGAQRFARTLGAAPVIVKAIAGGGGRGMRIVEDPTDLPAALARSRSEADRGFGNPDVYVEQLLPRARHIEVQVIGDGGPAPRHLFDRDCTLHRRHQKVIEIAPAPRLPHATRLNMRTDALALAAAAGLRGLATVEFLVDADDPATYYFIETNARLQVEHGITEQITGLDLVALQLAVATGTPLHAIAPLAALHAEPRGVAIEARICATNTNAGHTITELRYPTDPWVRVDTHLDSGAEVNPAFDPLLAKFIVHLPDGTHPDAVDHLAEVLDHVTIGGIDTDLALVTRALRSGELARAEMTTRTFDRMLATAAATPSTEITGSRSEIRAQTPGTVLAVPVAAGDLVTAGAALVVVEAMKMETEVCAPLAGQVADILVDAGDTVTTDTDTDTVVAVVAAVVTHAVDAATTDVPVSNAADLVDLSRDDVTDIVDRHHRFLDPARPDAVAATGKRTVRENLSDLLDDGSFREYGALVIAAQRRRRSIGDLERETPADGLVAGFGTIAHRLVAVLADDYTVLAGTQGLQSHKKAERLLDLAARRRTPVVVYAEGGGGRPGDTDNLAKATGRTWAPSSPWDGSTAWSPPSPSLPGAASPATPPSPAPVT
ncbi:MAG TPA: biotin carboxylase N-terminal domain-containing protein [Aldersonia sp.]